MTASANSSHGRLMALVPESVGEWKRTVLRGPAADPDRAPEPGAEAEFRRGDVVLKLRLAETALAPASAPAVASERQTDSGTERVAAEGSGTVRETVRRADGRLDLVLVRADRVVVSVQGYRTTMNELRAVALAVGPLPR